MILNINSLLPKIDELRHVARLINAAVIRFSESKLDKSITNSEILIDNYDILLCDRNRNGGGVACYVISQYGVINMSAFDHQLIYCTRKINKIETGCVRKLFVCLKSTLLMLTKMPCRKSVSQTTNYLMT